MLRITTAAALLALASTATAAELRLDITGLADDRGAVVIAVYSETDAFLARGAEPSFHATAAIADGRARWTFPGVAPGAYAVAVYHDRNRNGELDANFVGIPTEPYAFSNQAKGMFGPPKFDKAAFRVEGAQTTLHIQLEGD